MVLGLLLAARGLSAAEAPPGNPPDEFPEKFPGEIVRLHALPEDGSGVLALRLGLDLGAVLAASPTGERLDPQTLGPEALPRPFLLTAEVRRQGRSLAELRYPLFVAASSSPDARVSLVLAHPLVPGRYEVTLRLDEARPGDTPPPSYRTVFTVEIPPADPEAEPLAQLLGRSLPLALGRPNLVLGPASLEISPPPPGLLLDRLPFSALAWGAEIRGVEWLLDGRPVTVASEPPFRVELDLGSVPREHRLTAIARDAGGAELARDEVRLNHGPHGFRVRLLEPRPGARARGTVRVRAAVEVPAGETLAHLDVLVGDRLAARLDHPPFVAAVAIPANGELTFVRAVATLANGTTTESTALLNAPPGADLVEVDLVQLYLSVSDRRGRPVQDLAEDEVRVFEDEQPQTLQSFQKVSDIPLDVAVLLDVSDSMLQELGEAAKAAERFFSTVLAPRDRAALVTFNHLTYLTVPFTTDHARLATGLQGLKAEGGTAIWDSLALALYHFGGLDGRRAVVVLSDGADFHSKLDYRSVVEYAQRVEARIYTIAMLPMVNPQSLEGKQSREHVHNLDELSRATGGRSFAVETAGQLARVYETISEELRSQYLATYPSTQAGAAPGYRRVRVEITRPGVKALTMQGYFAE